MGFLEDRNRRDIVKKMLSVSAILILLLGTGTFAYMKLEHWGFVDSLYFSTTTLSTIGYGDLHPTNPSSKIFTVFYILLGVATMFYILSVLGAYYFQYLESHRPAIEDGLKEAFNKITLQNKGGEWVMLKVKDLKDKTTQSDNKTPKLKTYSASSKR